MSNVLWRDIRHTFQRKDYLIRQLIFVNVAVFLILNLVRLIYFLSGTPLDTYFYSEYIGVPASLPQLLVQPWTLISYMFTHGEPLHLIFNLLYLYWFGKILAEFLGHSKMLPVYLLGGLSGAVFYIASYNVFPVFSESVAQARLWGASASALAIVVAAATLVPDYVVFLFLLGPVKLKWIAAAVVALDIVFISFSNPGGHISHLGGALFGFFYIQQLRAGRDLGGWMQQLTARASRLFSRKPTFQITYKNKQRIKAETPARNIKTSRQERLDLILDRISKSGYESLSKEEKDFLFQMSRED